MKFALPFPLQRDDMAKSSRLSPSESAPESKNRRIRLNMIYMLNQLKRSHPFLDHFNGAWAFSAQLYSR
jgi:hypothetical protein